MSQRKERVASNVEWKAWGKIDPLYAVATWQGKQKGGDSPWNNEEFYSLGKQDWHRFLTLWQTNGLTKSNAGLEIGCGAGRLTVHAANYFADLYAIDVSEHMIEYAKSEVPSSNVHFYVTDGVEIPLTDNQVGAVFSTHVFQHFDSLAHARLYFQEIYRVLSTDGSMMIHLPVHLWPSSASPVFERMYNWWKAFGDLRASANRILVARGLSTQPVMRYLSYPADWLYDVLGEQGFTNIDIKFTLASNSVLHPFLFAKK